MEKIILNTSRNNGYGCSCCARSWDDTEEIEKDEMITFAKVIEKALAVDPYGEYGGIIEYIYEQNEKYLYGYQIQVSRHHADIYIWINDEKYPLKTKSEKNVSVEELLKIYEKGGY